MLLVLGDVVTVLTIASMPQISCKSNSMAVYCTLGFLGGGVHVMNARFLLLVRGLVMNARFLLLVRGLAHKTCCVCVC